MFSPTRVLICGTGSAAHVLGTVISAQPGVEVRVLTLNAVRAREWRQIAAAHRLTVTIRGEEPSMITARPFTITSDPRCGAAGADAVIISVPAFLHLDYLTALAPHLEEGCTIVGLPGQNGFEFDVRRALGTRRSSFVVLNFESLPWICRTEDFGRAATIRGSKNRLIGAMQGDPRVARIPDPLPFLQSILGTPPELIISGHPLGITLRSPNGYSHPPIMFSRWKDWDGAALADPPLFYEGVDEPTAELLGDISEEVIATSERIMANYPGVDLTQVIPMYDWDIGCYGPDIADQTNLMTAMRTNAGYLGITHPMICTASGEYVPDFQHRFLAEDVPFGLVVVRGVAELAGVPTPNLDRVLAWSQQMMGKEYLVGSRLTGKDVPATRCPQRYGFTMDDILVT